MISASNNCSKIFRINPYGSYNFIFQSSRNKRGVGILIKNSLVFAESARESDPDDNFLLLRVTVQGSTMIIGSVYGPNDPNPDFFTRLEAAIISLGNWPVILGGDWNCTFSADPILTNIDCKNMANPPNIRHSKILKELCSRLNLTDPYRLFFPTRHDYTFCPRNANQLNRSRIDFFLISIPLFVASTSCDILPALQNSLFDHKAINIEFKTKKLLSKGNPAMSKSIVSEKELDIVVKLAAAECYGIHNLGRGWELGEKDQFLLDIGTNRTAFRLQGPPPTYLPMAELEHERLRNREEAIDNIRAFCENIDFERLEEMDRSCDHSIFLEIFLNAIKNETISYQSFLYKIKKDKVKHLIDSLAHEKSSVTPDCDKINVLESRLNNYWDEEMGREIEHYSLFEHVKWKR